MSAKLTGAELRLYGMKAAYDEIIGTAVKRQHEPQRVVGHLLTAEINEKQARSIRYQISIAKLPLAKEAPGAPAPLTRPLQHLLARPALARIDRVEKREWLHTPTGQIVGEMKHEMTVRQVFSEMLSEFAETVERVEEIVAG